MGAGEPVAPASAQEGGPLPRSTSTTANVYCGRREHRLLLMDGPQWSPEMPVADNAPLSPTEGLTYCAGWSREEEDA
ncbi:hypothetical protein Taro_021181 [Colocasia esculenta]|uniref:Uncharacterized protein n=1 Tax=Colocasia esculenta TaxID=4460 RepID=A0A843V0N6_COLES|nr:hypothetical protein [Colocasia esculenta]